MKCPICDSQYDKLISLSLHYRKTHNGTAKQLRIDLFHDGQEPTCACGCGTSTKFMSVEKGFTEYAWGHQAKVKNNWGHNVEARAKSIDTRREMWKNGDIKAWCSGLTKDDPRVNAMIEKGRQTILANDAERQRRSDYMKMQWDHNIITPLTGSAHSQWRGGTSELGAMCRSRLYREWSFPKMKAAGFKCAACGATRDLEVHHDGERFSEILQKGIETLGEPGDDFDRKSCFVDWVLWYHAEADVSGRVLCSPCHEAEHHGHAE